MKQLEINTFRPRMRVLSEEQAWAIHHAALQILEHTGQGIGLVRCELPEVFEVVSVQQLTRLTVEYMHDDVVFIPGVLD